MLKTLLYIAGGIGIPFLLCYGIIALTDQNWDTAFQSSVLGAGAGVICVLTLIQPWRKR